MKNNHKMNNNIWKMKIKTKSKIDLIKKYKI